MTAFIVFAADWTARYFQEHEFQAKHDPVVHRLQEKRGLGALLKAAKPWRTEPGLHGTTLGWVVPMAILWEAFQCPKDASAPLHALHVEFARIFARLPFDSGSWW